MSRLLLAAVILAGNACSPSAGPAAVDTPDTGDLFSSTGSNNKFTDRNSACTRFAAAAQKQADLLHCKLDPPVSCPDFIDRFEKNSERQSVRDGAGCWNYDEGTLANCEARIASYTSCGDFSAKPCAFGLRLDMSGKGCGLVDGGSTDTGAEAGAMDAAMDSSPTDSAEAG